MFRSRARGLHKKMWWNNCKVRETNHENYTIFNLLKYTYYSNKIHILFYHLLFCKMCYNEKMNCFSDEVSTSCDHSNCSTRDYQ